jgi:hypothetical protein
MSFRAFEWEQNPNLETSELEALYHGGNLKTAGSYTPEGESRSVCSTFLVLLVFES